MLLFRPLLRSIQTTMSTQSAMSTQTTQTTQYPEDTAAIRRMIRYRCEHAGVKEVEILLKQWIDLNLELMNREQLVQFHEEVLTQETPDLYKILLGKDKTPDLTYLQHLRNFVQAKLDK